MGTAAYPPLYRSAEGYRQVVAHYDRLLARWTAPYESCFVPTHCGRTHVVVSGREDAPPLILLHGASQNAAMWLPTIAWLNKHFHLFAVDIPGEGGKSDSVHLSRLGTTCAEWLIEVMDGLGIERAHIAGISLGGWLSLLVAMYAPERVDRVAALCPAGFLHTSPLFLTCAGLAALIPTRENIRHFLRFLTSPSQPVGEEIVDGVYLIFKHLRLNISPIFKFTDGQLRAIQSPLLVMVGDHEVLYSTRAAVARAQQLNIPCRVIPNAGHGLTSEQPEMVARSMIEFFNGVNVGT